LKEAIVFGGSENTKIRLLIDDVRAIISDREIDGNSGSEYVVDEGMAMFLQLKGWAELVPS
jgi:hypothetical protein